MIGHIGFGVNGFSVKDPFKPLIDRGALEAAVQAYERRWGPSSDGGRAQVEYIIVAYLSTLNQPPLAGACEECRSLLSQSKSMHFRARDAATSRGLRLKSRSSRRQ